MRDSNFSITFWLNVPILSECQPLLIIKYNHHFRSKTKSSVFSSREIKSSYFPPSLLILFLRKKARVTSITSFKLYWPRKTYPKLGVKFIRRNSKSRNRGRSEKAMCPTFLSMQRMLPSLLFYRFLAFLKRVSESRSQLLGTLRLKSSEFTEQCG